MSAHLPPMHPYNVMLFRISVFLKADIEKVHALGRIMGCRDLQNVTTPWMLFEKLEDMGCLSEFKVTDLKKALDLIGLSEAGSIVEEYEDKEVRGKPMGNGGHLRPSETNTSSYNVTPSPPPPYSFTEPSDENCMHAEENEETYQESERTKPLSSQEWVNNDEGIPNTPMGTDTPVPTRTRFKPKYHTLAAIPIKK